MPLQVTGIDGRAALGVGSACEMKYDECAATPADQLCEAWLRRLDEAEFKWKYAGRDSEADAIEAAVSDALNGGARTTDIAAGGPAASTTEFGDEIRRHLARRLGE